MSSRKKPTARPLPAQWTDFQGAMAITTFGEEKLRSLAKEGKIEAKRLNTRIIFRISRLNDFIETLPDAYAGVLEDEGA